MPRKDNQTDYVVHFDRARRRGRMLELCATFLRSVAKHSDDLVRLSGRSRGSFAQAEYTLALDIADSIAKEIANDARRYDDNGNETPAIRRARAASKRASGERGGGDPAEA